MRHVFRVMLLSFAAVVFWAGTIDGTFNAPIWADDPSTERATSVVMPEGGGNPPNSPVRLTLASDFESPQSVDLATTCKRIRLWNDGAIGNNAPGYALDYLEDCDTFNINTVSSIYLYKAAPVVCRINGDDTLRFTAYSKTDTDPDGMRPLAPWTVDNSNADYTKASTRYATADSTIGFVAEYYAPKAAEYCGFVVQDLKFFSLTDAPLGEVLVGEILDWDIPSDSGARNGSGLDMARNLIYQYGAEYNQDDSTEAYCAQESDQRFGGIAAGLYYPSRYAFFKNARTIDNATYIDTTGPYGNMAPLPAGATYRMMKNGEDYSCYSSSDPDSEYVDLSTLVTFGEFDMTNDDTVCITTILATTKTGLTSLNNIIDMGWTFIRAHPEMDCMFIPCCCEMPGDANGDWTVNVGDAVYIINYVFKGGDTPQIPRQADANADASIDAGDAVYLINYIFKGGDDPICGP